MDEGFTFGVLVTAFAIAALAAAVAVSYERGQATKCSQIETILAVAQEATSKQLLYTHGACGGDR